VLKCAPQNQQHWTVLCSEYVTAGSTGLSNQSAEIPLICRRRSPLSTAISRNCRVGHNVPLLAATPLFVDTTRRKIVRKSHLFGHSIFVFAFHYAHCTFWMFPSSTTKAVSVLENSRNIRQKSFISHAFLRMGFIIWLPSLRSGEAAEGVGVGIVAMPLRVNVGNGRGLWHGCRSPSSDTNGGCDF
jgi:hypothetical protein